MFQYRQSATTVSSSILNRLIAVVCDPAVVGLSVVPGDVCGLIVVDAVGPPVVAGVD